MSNILVKRQASHSETVRFHFCKNKEERFLHNRRKTAIRSQRTKLVPTLKNGISAIHVCHKYLYYYYKGKLEFVGILKPIVNLYNLPFLDPFMDSHAMFFNS